jgi:hypothetical protein
MRILTAIAITAAVLVTPAAASGGYTYDVRDLSARSVKVQLALLECSVQKDRSSHAGVWLGVGDATSSTWVQAGVGCSASRGRIVYVETRTPAHGVKLTDLGWYELGAMVTVELVKGKAVGGRTGWSVRVNGQRYGPVRIAIAYVQAGGESFDALEDANTYRGVVKLPGGRTFYPSK